MLYGFDYFVRFGTAAGPDHATMPRLRYDSIGRVPLDILP